ncbi:MAG: FtsX-like permease family protein, partial [Acidobacteriota bacterium]
FFPDGALGQRLRLRTDPEGSWRTVVGVVADVEHHGRLAHWQEVIYVPSRGVDYPHPMTILLRAEGDPLRLAATVRERVQGLDPQVPVASLVRMEDVVAHTKATPRLHASLLGAFGASAVILAMIGLHGVMAVWVADRRQEMGLRLALGAERGAILARVLGRGLGLVLLGAVVGLVASWPAIDVLRSQIPGLGAPKPWLQGAAAVLLVLTSAVTALVPASRAARVDPSIALREL